MEYLDFELRIAPGAGREYPVSVLQSPAGETSATMRFPFDTLALQNQLQGIEIAVLRSGGTRRDVASDEHQMGVSEFGRKLFEALMTDTVRETFRRSQDRARVLGKGLRLRLRIDAPELASLPWEYLYDPAEGDYVCLSTDTPVVRYLEFDRPPEALTIQPPISILGVTSSPANRPALDVARERLRVEAATAALREAGLLKLTWLGGSTWRDLQKAMRQGPYHIFHFIGHGGFDSTTGEGVIALTDDQNKSALMSATQLGRLLSDHQSLRMVVLNSCLGAKGSSTDVFSSTASILVRRGVSAVVAMQYEISDLAAVEFARSLYEALADGIPVDAAVAEARKAISLSVSNTVEWGTPVLYMRSPDGRLFNIHGMTTSMARASGTYRSMPVQAITHQTEPSLSPSSPPMSSAPLATVGSGGRRGLFIGLAAVILAMLAGGYFLVFSRSDESAAISEVPSGFKSPVDTSDTTDNRDTTNKDTTTHPVTPPPAITPQANPWLQTKASIGGVRAENVRSGVWNMTLTVYYTGPKKDTEATVDCMLRPDEGERQAVRFVVPLEHGRKGGDYTQEIQVQDRWPNGAYPIACAVDGNRVHTGEVKWLAKPDEPPVAKSCPSVSLHLTSEDLNSGTPNVYTMRPGRCEGEFLKKKEVISSPVVVASLTSAFESTDPASVKAFRVSWPTPSAGDVHLRARKVTRDERTITYGMDAFVAPGSTGYDWPTDIVAGLGLKPPDLGLVAWTYEPVGGASRLVYLPIRVSASAAGTPAQSYNLVLVPKAQLTSLTVLFGPANPDGTPVTGKQTKIAPTPVGSTGPGFDVDRPVRVSLPIDSPGLYLLQISESMVAGFGVKSRSEKPIIIDTSP